MCCIFYYIEFYACSDRANKANLFISAFFLQAAKSILMPLYAATSHISQLVVFLTTVTVSSTSLWDSTKGSSNTKLIQWNSRNFLEYRTEPNRTESNSIELVRSNRTEFFQYFYVFSSSVRSNRTRKNHWNASNTSCKIIQMQ